MERPLEELAPPDPAPPAADPSDPDGPGEELDLAAIGLAVFFVAMILVVGALLILPAIF